jgi:hypothetical protein
MNLLFITKFYPPLDEFNDGHQPKDPYNISAPSIKKNFSQFKFVMKPISIIKLIENFN